MRLLIFILLFPFVANSQVIMTARYTARAAASCTYFLDSFPTASMVYSLRKLSCTYSGSAIRVRRSSDNTEQDIGFVSDYVDTASMKTFVTSNSAYVVTFYDQSGNGYNATQSTAANQPRIMNAGAIEYQNSKVTMYFDGSNDGLVASSVPLNTYTTLFAVVKTTTGKPMFFEHSPNANHNDGFYFYGSNGQSWYFKRSGSGNDASGSGSWLGSNIAVASLIYNGSGTYYKNGTSQSNGSVNGSSLSNTSTTKDFYIFYRGGGVLSDGYLSEFVLWSSDKSSNRTAIEYNIKTYYSVY